MQFNRLAVVSRDETEVLGYQLQVTATIEEWETVKKWMAVADSIVCDEARVVVFHKMLKDTISG